MASYHAKPEWVALCKAIIIGSSRPTPDLLPRLVAADWLDENHEPERAELIRQQLTGDVNSLQTLSSRIIELLSEANWLRWSFSRSRNWDREKSAKPVAAYSGGFVTEVRCEWAVWEQYGPLLASQNPIRALSITDKAPFMGTEWGFRQSTPFLSRHQLPAYMLHFFRGGKLNPYVTDPGAALLEFPSGPTAEIALMNACIAWGRWAADTAINLSRSEQA